MPSLLRETTADSKRHLNLFDLTKGVLTFEELEQAFKMGFERAFAIRLAQANLTEEEHAFVSLKINAKVAVAT